MNVHPRLRELIQGLPAQSGTKAFVYATGGKPETPLRRYTHSLTTLLAQRGFTVLDTVTCRGLGTWLPMRIVGGGGEGHPAAADLHAGVAAPVGEEFEWLARVFQASSAPSGSIGTVVPSSTVFGELRCSYV